MKKTILTFIALLSLVTVCFSASIQDAHKAALARKNAGGTAADDCAGTDLMFSWHMENDDSTPDVTIHDDSSTPIGCSDGDDVGLIDGAPVFSSAAGQAGVGTLALLINDKSEHYEFSVSNDDIVNLSDIKFTFNLYISALPASSYCYVTQILNNADDFIYFQLQSDGTFRAQHQSGGNMETLDLGSVIDDPGDIDEWLSCEYQADHSQGVSNDHYITCTGETPAEEDETFTGETRDSAGTLKFGDQNGAVACTFYIDDVKIYSADRWD